MSPEIFGFSVPWKVPLYTDNGVSQKLDEFQYPEPYDWRPYTVEDFQAIDELNNLFRKNIVVRFTEFFFPIGIGLCTLLIIWIVYLNIPANIRKKRKLKKLEVHSKNSNLYNEIVNIAKKTDISPVPTIEFTPHDWTANAQVFGKPSLPSIHVGGRMELLFRKEPEKARAILLHEFAHIANKDIGPTYLSEAFWVCTSFLLGTLFILSSSFFIGTMFWFQRLNGQVPIVSITALISIIRIGISLIIIRYAYRSVLRIREFYADWQTTNWEGQGALMALLSMQQNIRNKLTEKIWGFHPTYQDRITTLKAPDRLLMMKGELSVIAGIMLGLLTCVCLFIALPLMSMTSSITGLIFWKILLTMIKESHQVSYHQMTVLLILQRIRDLADLIPYLLIVFPPITLFALIIDRQIIPSAVIDSYNHVSILKCIRNIMKHSVLIAFGIEIGLLISPIPIFYLSITPVGLVFFPLGIVFFSIFLIIWISGIYLLSKLLIGAHIGKKTPTLKFGLIHLTSILMLTMFFPLATFARVYMQIFFKLPSGWALESFGTSLDLVPGELEIFTWIFFAFIVILTIICFFYSMFILISFAAISLKRKLIATLCPSCHTKIQHRAIGAKCPTCGDTISKWLFIAS